MSYTDIDDPSAHFQVATWSGTGSSNAVTFDGNSDMQPDLVWSKRRDVGYNHVLKTTSLGGTSDNDIHLVPNLGNAKSTYSNYRMDFNSDEPHTYQLKTRAATAQPAGRLLSRITIDINTSKKADKYIQPYIITEYLIKI